MAAGGLFASRNPSSSDPGSGVEHDRGAVVEAKLDLIKLDYSRSELETTFIRLVEGADASN